MEADLVIWMGKHFAYAIWWESVVDMSHVSAFAPSPLDTKDTTGFTILDPPDSPPLDSQRQLLRPDRSRIQSRNASTEPQTSARLLVGPGNASGASASRRPGRRCGPRPAINSPPTKLPARQILSFVYRSPRRKQISADPGMTNIFTGTFRLRSCSAPSVRACSSNVWRLA